MRASRSSRAAAPAARPCSAPLSGRAGAMVYVAASPVERLGAVLSTPGGGPTVLVVPEAELVGGHPRGVRSARHDAHRLGLPGLPARRRADATSARAPRIWWRERRSPSWRAETVADERRGPHPQPRRRRALRPRSEAAAARGPGRASVGAPGHLHRAGRLRARAVGDAGAPRAGMAAGRAAGAGGGAGRRGAADRPPEPGGGGRGVHRDHPPGLPGLRTALALAQAHEHRAHDAPDRARASTSCPTRWSPTWAPTPTCAW